MLVRDIGLLAIHLHKMDRDQCVKLLDEIASKYPQLKDITDSIKSLIDAGLWERAWSEFEYLVTEAAKVAGDPVISAYVPEETYEQYTEAAEAAKETVSSYARAVLEGRRSPATPPDGVKASEEVSKAVEEALKEEEPEFVKYVKQQMEAAEKSEAEWEKTLREYEKYIQTS